MRRDKFDIGNYFHVYNRGNRKEEIVRATSDKWRFLQALRFFNDSHSSLNILRDLGRLISDINQTGETEPGSVFDLGWPPDWPEKDPLVKILCYCLITNHFHLLLKEIRPGGISKFMQKLGIGYTNFFNLKYQEVGKVFQGTYKVKPVNEQKYLEHLCVYIQVINVLEFYPGGLEYAVKNPDDAIKFVDDFPFSSHRDYAGLRRSLIIDKDILGEMFPTPRDYREFVHGSLLARSFSDLPENFKLE